MGDVRRDIPSDMVQAIGARVVRPLKLVRLNFGGTLGVKCFSTGPVVVHAGETYFGDACDVEDLSWDGGAGQTGSIRIYNDPNHPITEWVLARGVNEVPVEIFDCYRLDDGSFATPVRVAKGTLTNSDLSMGSVDLQMVTAAMDADRIPYRTVSPLTGFNWLPAEGSALTWGSETYIFESN